MHNNERKRNLLQFLKNHKSPVKLELLAEKYSCSTKTIRRYIDDLVTERSAPWFISNGVVHFDRARQQQIEMDDYWFTSEELLSLLALYQITEELSVGLLSSHLDEFKIKILAILGSEDESQRLVNHVKIIPIANPPIKNDLFNKITYAIASQKQLKIQFWNRKLDQVTDRNISPYQLIRYRDHWLLDAYCHQKEALRSFSLEAIIQIDISQQTTKPINSQRLKDYFQSSYGIFSGQADKVAILIFSTYQARWIKDQIWHPEQTFKWLDDGRYQLQIPYKEDTELMQDILKYGAQVEVVSPVDLRQKVTKQLQKTLALYQDS